MLSVSRFLRTSHVPEVMVSRCIGSDSSSNYVYWLSSGNIYRNLAFETTLFNTKTRYAIKSSQFRRADVVMWRSDPCVVIGRNQIAWLEANPREVESRGWHLARRLSGGGAVFHDHGNLNISFLESRKNFDRRKCMEFLKQSLVNKWGMLNIFIGPRHDLWLLPSDLSGDIACEKVPEGALKFSGSAARFSSTVGLHHCTLMFDTDVNAMSAVLQPAVPEIETKASRSIPSPVKNLGVTGSELKSTLLEALQEWLRPGAAMYKRLPIPWSIKLTPIFLTPDLKKTILLQNSKVNAVVVNAGEEGNWVNAKDFEENLTNFQSWDWIYGSSPKFSIPLETDDGTILRLNCEKGRVAKLEQIGGLTPPVHLLRRISSAITGSPVVNPWLNKLNEVLVGKPLSFEAIHNALLEFEMSNNVCVETCPPVDPFDHHSQIIDRLRAVATSF